MRPPGEGGRSWLAGPLPFCYQEQAPSGNVHLRRFRP